MTRLTLKSEATGRLDILCLGAHPDDIEIGCGGTLLRLLEEHPESRIHWVVFGAHGARETEARTSARLFAGPHLGTVLLKSFQDGFMPYVGGEVKTVFETELKPIPADLIFTHNGLDAHQDHRLIAELTWNTFRDHLILEYEIPKYDGDLGRPSLFVPLSDDMAQKKTRFILDAFQSQRAKPWFEERTFLSLLRLRGMECNATSGNAEAFYCRKLVL